MALTNDGWTTAVHANFKSPINNAKWEFIKVYIKSATDSTYFATNGNNYGYGGV